MILQKGRPTDTNGRLKKEIQCYDFLDSLGIGYERVDHEPAFHMEICKEIEQVLDADICKNLFLCNRQRTAFYLLMIPGNKTFHTKELSHQIGSSRLSFASAEDMEQYLNVSPGSVSIMGLLFDAENHVRLLVDEDLLAKAYLGCHPCVNTSSLKLKTTDILGPLLKGMQHHMTVVKLGI